MAANANFFVKKSGYVDGSSEAGEVPAALVTALADSDQSVVVIESPQSSGKKYTLVQAV